MRNLLLNTILGKLENKNSKMPRTVLIKLIPLLLFTHFYVRLKNKTLNRHLTWELREYEITIIFEINPRGSFTVIKFPSQKITKEKKMLLGIQSVLCFTTVTSFSHFLTRVRVRNHGILPRFLFWSHAEMEFLTGKMQISHGWYLKASWTVTF